MSCNEWQGKIPTTKSPFGIIFFIINVLFWPGLGTILAAFINTNGKMEQCTLIIGVIQWFTCWLLIGWIWAIWWGWLIFKKQAK